MFTALKTTFVPLHELQGNDVVSVLGEGPNATPITRSRANAPIMEGIARTHTSQKNWQQIGNQVAIGLSEDLADPKTRELLEKYLSVRTWREDLQRNKAAQQKLIDDFNEHPQPTPEMQEQLAQQVDALGKKPVTPLGVDPARLDESQGHLEKLIEQNPGVARAWRATRQVLDAFREELKTEGWLPDDARLDYWPKIILDRLYQEGKITASAPKTGKTGFLKTRQGTVRDPLADFTTTIAKYVAEQGSMLEKARTYREMAEHADIRNNPRLNPKTGKNYQYQPGDEIPEGYTRANLGLLRQRLVARSIEDRLHIEAKDGLAEELAKSTGLRRDQLEELMSQVGRSRGVGEKEYILPTEVWNSMYESSKGDQRLSPVSKWVQKGNAAYKTFVLGKMPVQYNSRNFFGDNFWSFVQFLHHPYDSKARVNDVIGDVYKVFTNQTPSDMYRISQKYGVPAAGRTATELGDLRAVKELRRLYEGATLQGSAKDAIKTALNIIGPRFSAAREDFLRQLIFRMNVERAQSGKKMLLGIADPERVKGLLDYEAGEPYAAAAYISKTSLGNYATHGDLTPSEDGWRRGLNPFYSWVKINTFLKPYRITKALVKPGDPTSKGTMAAGLGATLAAVAAVRVWNSYVMGDAEDKLPEQFRTGNHIILADPNEYAKSGQITPWMTKDDRGRMRPKVVAVPDPIDDILQWYGFDGVPADIMTALKGHIPWKEVLNRYVDKNVLEKPLSIGGKIVNVPIPGAQTARTAISQLGPLYQGLPALMGKKTFPDPFRPGDVGEEGWFGNVAKVLGLGGMPMLEAKQGSNVFDPVGQLGGRSPVMGQQSYWVDELKRRQYQLDGEIKDIESRLSGIMGGVRETGNEKPEVLQRRQTLLNLIRSKNAEMRRIGQRLEAISRTEALARPK